MRCLSCGHEFRSTTKFCGECGMAVSGTHKEKQAKEDSLESSVQRPAFAYV